MKIRTGDRFQIPREGAATVVREIPSLFDESPDMAVAFVRFDRGGEVVERRVDASNRIYTTPDLFGALTGVPPDANRLEEGA